MPASGLLISCATEAASRPSEDSFSDRTSWSWARLRASVRSSTFCSSDCSSARRSARAAPRFWAISLNERCRSPISVEECSRTFDDMSPVAMRCVAASSSRRGRTTERWANHVTTAASMTMDRMVMTRVSRRSRSRLASTGWSEMPMSSTPSTVRSGGCAWQAAVEQLVSL